MGRAASACQGSPPQATGTRTGNSRVSEPSPGRPLILQNANFALDVSKRGYVLETGKVVMSDESATLRTNPEVQKAYLGT